ncbi:MAG: esterase [Candidatus Kapabacteria bacterium]|nr:esterase [Ignavibacteriota bacterium]MCW5885298.1 esterase [Candidatus Kapabacteria bacterium]
MDIKKDILYSEKLGRDMQVSIYGHYGISVLMFPAITDNADEYENEGTINAIEHLIKIGKCKVFVTSSIDKEIWFGGSMEPKEKSHLHFKFNQYVEDELVPYIYGNCGGPLPVITAGAGKGAYHAANSFFRRPDIFLGAIAMSGDYDLGIHTYGYFDDNCYYNSPIHYLPNLNDNYWLSFLHSRRHIYLTAGSGKGENPENSKKLAYILTSKGIRHHFEIKDENYSHDFKSWNAILNSIIEGRL